MIITFYQSVFLCEYVCSTLSSTKKCRSFWASGKGIWTWFVNINYWIMMNSKIILFLFSRLLKGNVFFGFQAQLFYWMYQCMVPGWNIYLFFFCCLRVGGDGWLLQPLLCVCACRWRLQYICLIFLLTYWNLGEWLKWSNQFHLRTCFLYIRVGKTGNSWTIVIDKCREAFVKSVSLSFGDWVCLFYKSWQLRLGPSLKPDVHKHI